MLTEATKRCAQSLRGRLRNDAEILSVIFWDGEKRDNSLVLGAIASAIRRRGVKPPRIAIQSIHPRTQSMPVQSDEATVPGAKQGRVDVIERIGAGESLYSSLQRGGDSIKLVENEEVVRRYSQPMSH